MTAEEEAAFWALVRPLEPRCPHTEVMLVETFGMHDGAWICVTCGETVAEP